MLAKPGPSLYTQYYRTVWYLRRSIFFAARSIAGYLQIRSAGLGIVIKNEKRQVNVKILQNIMEGIKIKGDKIGMPCTHCTVI